MKFSNRLGLPQAIVNAMQNDPYSKNGADYSVTELLKPARIRALTEKHKEELSEDVEDGLYRLYGQIVHGILERGNAADLAEKRFFGTFSGKIVSGQIDTLTLDANEILSDFKFTTAYKFKPNQEPEPDWVSQMNLQLELLRINGYDAEKLQIVGLIRDHSKLEAKRSPDSYPQSPIAILDIPIWPREKTVAFINMRIAEHESAKQELPECSDSDRWAKKNAYAVVKGARAVNGGVQYSLAAAKEILKKHPGARIEFRPGENVRCANYCSVAQFCSQYQELIKQNNNEDKVG